MKQKNIKLLKYKLSVYSLLLLSLLSPMNKNKNRGEEVNIKCADKLSYSNGNIFVLNNNLEVNTSSTQDIIVIDERHTHDPNIKIIDSYKIKDKDYMKEIIDKLIEYNELNNIYEWKRTKESMYKEWIIHNICYNLGIRVNRSRDVDFNNADELVYVRRLD